MNKKITNEAYWMQRDQKEKMESLYGCPFDFPEDDPLRPARGIVTGLVVTSFLAFVGVVAYFAMSLCR